MIRIIHGWFSNSGSDGPNKVLFFTEAAWFCCGKDERDEGAGLGVKAMGLEGISVEQ